MKVQSYDQHMAREISPPDMVFFAKKKANRKVIVADDAPEARLIASRSLEFDGYRCLPAENGHQVLRLAKMHRPQLVILDLMLPSLDGFQVLLRLQDLAHKPKVCVVTSFDDPQYIRRAFEFGADDFLVKPIVPDVLSYKAGTILGEVSRDAFFGLNADLDVRVEGKFGEYASQLVRLSEMGASLVADRFHESVDDLILVKSPELQRLLDVKGPLFAKVIAVQQNPNRLDVEFVALPEHVLGALRSVVMRGQYLSTASLQN